MYRNDSRTVQEAYSTAGNSSNLRFCVREGASRSDADLLVAAGWSRSRVGGALLRLHSEYDGADHSGMPRSDMLHASPKDRSQDVEQRLALRHAQVLARLKTLPQVREQLAAQATRWRIDAPHSVATAVLYWWLQPTCSACEGRKFESVPGTARLSSRACKACAGTGLSRVPHGEAGRRMANFIDDCVHRARQSIGNRLHSIRS
ncbi:hypothetical protein C8244_14795 [Paracidovorax avenae]|uniref:hypothetical protein n=1 Tax=Paracidovorax avenae TaxID=80867 RepID=UPI000D16BDAE|nr:hypothetical protein [Paracidovorax avenae]AVS82167.1 hypothetical protein C8237_14435 [Paracidovorax avenae]AVT17345.1 hypothetical protein C8244_14795 [Paracidovorax avenae]